MTDWNGRFRALLFHKIMSTRYNPESYNDNRRLAGELHNGPEHAHDVAERHGKQDHLTGTELSRQALEESKDAHRRTHASPNGHGVETFGHAEIAALAHQLWQARGCPEGSPEEDWYHAAEQLRSLAHTR